MTLLPPHAGRAQNCLCRQEGQITKKNISGWLQLNGVQALEYCQPAARLWNFFHLHALCFAVLFCYFKVSKMLYHWPTSILPTSFNINVYCFWKACVPVYKLQPQRQMLSCRDWGRITVDKGWTMTSLRGRTSNVVKWHRAVCSYVSAVPCPFVLLLNFIQISLKWIRKQRCQATYFVMRFRR